MKALSIYDPSLTPANAAFKGFEYIDDVILGITNKSQSTKEFLQIIEDNHFKLGIPTHNETDYMGLYVPVEDFNNTI